MKATINGITYEGTPEEIMRMRQLQQEQMRNKLYKSVTDINVKKAKCPNEGYPCYCTGACMGITTGDPPINEKWQALRYLCTL